MFKRIGLFLVMNIAVIVVLTVLFAVLENIFGLSSDLYGFNYLSIFIYSLIVGFTGSFISLALSRYMAKKAYKIAPIKKENISELGEKEKIVWNIVEELSERNHITMPEVGVYINNDPNAFATGMTKNKSLVAVSSGLLNTMDKNAIEGVIGHEMAHILNGDMVTMTLLQGVLNTFVIFFSRIISNIIANMLDENISRFTYFAINILLQILLGILASLVAMKFSRYREFKADAASAKFLGKEKMLAGLKALKNMEKFIVEDKSNLATMKISNKNKKGFLSLFSSHPNLDLRIEKLENLII